MRAASKPDGLLSEVLREALAGAEADLGAGRLRLGRVGLLREGVDGLLAALVGRLDLLGEGADAGDGDALVLLQELRDRREGGVDGLLGLLAAEPRLLGDVLDDVRGPGAGSHGRGNPSPFMRPPAAARTVFSGFFWKSWAALAFSRRRRRWRSGRPSSEAGRRRRGPR